MNFLKEYGLAFFTSQTLEFSMISLIGLNNKIGMFELEMTTQEVMDTFFGRTMGNATNKILEKIDIGHELSEKLPIALDARNWLVHNFYRENAALLSVDERIDEVTILVRKARILFEESVDLINDEIMKLYSTIGINQEEALARGCRAINQFLMEDVPTDVLWNRKHRKSKWAEYSRAKNEAD